VDVNAAAEEAPAMPLAPSRLAGQEAPLPVDGRVISPLEAHTNNRFQRGLLVHKLLQHLPDVALKERAESARRYLSLSAHGLDQKEIDDTLAEVMAILSDPTFAPIFGPGSLAETPLVGRLPDDGRLLSGQVDRLLVTPEQILIIDYKTNRPPPSQPEQMSPLYVRQMAAYRALLQEIYPGRPVTAALLWTVGPHLMILPEDVMATALNSI
jgi:ATP-dependent helicase/nuclease subunit A